MWPFSKAYPERSLADIDNKTFDYIIVGGGTAGCVLASRLSEDPEVSVLLVEKGPIKDVFMSRCPLASQNFAALWVSGVLDRFTEPIEEYNGRRFQLPSGECLGGTSRLNGQLVTRGLPAAYNEWADVGLEGWNWEVVEPYFRKLENALDHPDTASRGHEGPLVNRQPGLAFEFYNFISKACAALGLPVEDDCNAATASAQGFFRLDAAVDARGTRMSTYRSYLSKPLALERQKRLAICTEAMATKLEIDSAANRVAGVHISSASGKSTRKNVVALARREVIVCNGAFRTPQLLMLSGIGPRDHLASASIECIHDLPAVGAHLSDHLSVPIMVDLPTKETVHTVLNPLTGASSFLSYVLFGKGLLSFPTNAATIFARTSSLDEETYTIRTRQEEQTQGGAEGPGGGQETVDTMDATKLCNLPDVEIMLNPVNCINRDLPERAYITLYTTLLQTFTTGRLELASTDPTAHLRVRYPLLGGDAGWSALRRAVRFTMRLVEEFVSNSGYPQPAALTFAPGMDMAELAILTRGSDWGLQQKSNPPEATKVLSAGAATAAPIPPGATPSELRKLTLKPVQKTWKTATDDEIDAYVKQVALSTLHFSGTCRMSVDDRSGVVDARLRVHGLTNLRIADASVFPKIPRVHPMVPVMMAAERCADFIKKDWEGK